LEAFVGLEQGFFACLFSGEYEVAQKVNFLSLYVFTQHFAFVVDIASLLSQTSSKIGQQSWL
jgi:hypothetical protein